MLQFDLIEQYRRGEDAMPKDFSKLIGRIIEVFGTRKAFAEAMGFTPEQLSRRLNNQTQFDSDEMAKAIDLLEIPPQEIYAYFLTPKVR